MRLVSFLFYYGKVRMATIAGVYRPCYPLDIKWRWRHRQRLKRVAGR